MYRTSFYLPTFAYPLHRILQLNPQRLPKHTFPLGVHHNKCLYLHSERPIQPYKHLEHPMRLQKPVEFVIIHYNSYATGDSDGQQLDPSADSRRTEPAIH